jgi:hypothetical protein
MDTRFRVPGHWIPAFAGMTEKNPSSFVTPAKAGVQEKGFTETPQVYSIMDLFVSPPQSPL